MAGDGSIANDPLFSDLLQKLIGTSTSSKTGEDLSVANLIKELTSQTSDHRLTGLTNQNTNQQQSGSSTNTQNQNQALTGNTTQNQTQTGSNTSTQNTTADISRLTQVFNQQQKGITPEALAAIFTQGAKAVPGLTAATANAVGARSSNNSALATSLTDLNSNLVSQASTQNQAMLNASGTTAAQIADLTKQLTTQQQNAGSTFGNTGTNQNTALTGTTGTVNNQNTVGNTSTNQSQNTSNISNQSVNTNQSQNSKKNSGTDTGTTINARSTGATLGAGLLASLVGGQGGIGGLLGNAGGFLGKLFGGGATGVTNGSINLNSNDLPYTHSNTGYGDIGTGITGSYDPNVDAFNPDNFGFADGGLVPMPQLSLSTPTKTVGPAIDVMKLLSSGGLGLGATGTDTGRMTIGTPVNRGGSNAAQREDTGGVAGASSTAPDSPTAQSAAVGNAIGHTVSAAVMSAIGLPPGVVAAFNAAMSASGHGKPVPTIASAIAAISAAAGGTSNPSGHSPSATVSIDGAPPVGIAMQSQAAADAENGINGDTSNSNNSGTNDAANGGTGTAGDSAGVGVGGTGGGVGSGVGGDGYADGGLLTRAAGDNNGTKDVIPIKATGGEYIMPKDVVDYLGPQLFDSIKAMFHVPVAQQEEMAEAPGTPENENAES